MFAVLMDADMALGPSCLFKMMGTATRQLHISTQVTVKRHGKRHCVYVCAHSAVNYRLSVTLSSERSAGDKGVFGMEDLKRVNTRSANTDGMTRCEIRRSGPPGTDASF